MMINPVLPTPVVPAASAAPAASAEGEFAQLLGGALGDPAAEGGFEFSAPAADPLDAAAAMSLILQSASQRRDQERAERAFGFGVFGVFPPGRADAAAAADLTDDDATAEASGPGERDGPIPSVPLAQALAEASLDPPGGATAGAAATGTAGPDFGPAAETPQGAMAGGIAVGPGQAPAGEADAPGEAPDRAAALFRRVPAERPAAPGPARLTLVDQDGRLSLVAGARLEPADQVAARARLRDAAASLGVGLDDIQINGLSGASPARGGGSHGGRTR